jgi:hypothetical protein
VLFLPASLSAQEQSSGIWKVDHAATLEIDAHDTCKEITNNHASGQPMMVPTGSSAQWSTFLSNLPAGVTADDCSGGGCIYTALAIGESCGDLIYAGESGGNRLYTTAADQGFTWPWATVNGGSGAESYSDGVANTNAMEANGFANYPAARSCRALGTEWYLPAREELIMLYNNRGDIGGFLQSMYWSSTDRGVFSGYNAAWCLQNGNSNCYTGKSGVYHVRCVIRNLNNTGPVFLNDSIPDAFTLTDQTDVAVSTLIESNIIQISGINTDTNISISGMGSPEYRICTSSNCSAVVAGWSSSARTFYPGGAYVQLRLTSSDSVLTERVATLDIGGVTDDWSVTTENTVALTYSGATHSETTCTAVGGSIVSVSGGTLCRFNASSCPSGWSQADNWSTAVDNSAACNSTWTYGANISCWGHYVSIPGTQDVSATVTASGYSWSNPPPNHNRRQYDYASWNYDGQYFFNSSNGATHCNGFMGGTRYPILIGPEGLCGTGISANAETVMYVYEGSMWWYIYNAAWQTGEVSPIKTQIGCK